MGCHLTNHLYSYNSLPEIIMRSFDGPAVILLYTFIYDKLREKDVLCLTKLKGNLRRVGLLPFYTKYSILQYISVFTR